jgi:hypothetical protein
MRPDASPAPRATPPATVAAVSRLKTLFLGGSDGNEHLTVVAGALLIVLLAVEGATLLQIRSLLTVHAFVGMLLVPVVVLKLVSTGWRMVRYYLRGEEYIRRGPPHVLLRVLVAPVIVVSTLVLFATGVALLAVERTQGPIVGLHKASFAVWFVATSVHVLTHLPKLLRVARRGLPGTALRFGLAGASVVAGLALAMLTLPAAEHLQDGLPTPFGVDDR